MCLCGQDEPRVRLFPLLQGGAPRALSLFLSLARSLSFALSLSHACACCRSLAAANMASCLANSSRSRCRSILRLSMAERR